jgi:hypothetical protein
MTSTSAGWPSAAAMLLLVAAVLLGAAALWWRPAWQARQRARLRAQPFPAAWRQILRQRVPLVARLPADLQQRLKGHIQVFIAEKPFIGCQGQAVGDEQRVTIAAQACLLLLGEASPDYFPALRQVLVYPSGFMVERVQHGPGGVQQPRPQALSGESWQAGQVILSWTDARAGAAAPNDGENLVLHEFAHQIDQDKGQADGRPWRPTRAARRRWDRVMGEAFNRLQQQPSELLGAYAATAPAEFLAVATERFFERPGALAAEAPAVYAELAGLYRVNPVAW